MTYGATFKYSEKSEGKDFYYSFYREYKTQTGCNRTFNKLSNHFDIVTVAVKNEKNSTVYSRKFEMHNRKDQDNDRQAKIYRPNRDSYNSKM